MQVQVREQGQLLSSEQEPQHLTMAAASSVAATAVVRAAMEEVAHTSWVVVWEHMLLEQQAWAAGTGMAAVMAGAAVTAPCCPSARAHVVWSACLGPQAPQTACSSLALRSEM